MSTGSAWNKKIYQENFFYRITSVIETMEGNQIPSVYVIFNFVSEGLNVTLPVLGFFA